MKNGFVVINYALFIQILFPTQIMAQEVIYVPGSTVKIEQLVGDFDRHLQQPTQNLTNTNYKLWGTDLGIPFQHLDRIYFLFGDVPGTDTDPMAYTTDTHPEDGLSLKFLQSPSGEFKPIYVPGVSQGAYEVPTEGFSIDSTIYIYHTTDGMNKSILAKSTDDGDSFDLVESSFSNSYFINVSVVGIDIAQWEGLPKMTGEGLLIFGSGSYRTSNVRLAFQPRESIERKSTLKYFSGLDPSFKPTWSEIEPDATPLFDQPCIGEFSVTYNPFIKKWIMLYNCDNPRGINFRTADQPWGSWSEAQLIFDPWQDSGYCHFIHVDWNFSNCDQVHDPGRANEWGGEYGPYQIETFSTGNDSKTTIYYTMSTWNPYTVVLMKSTLAKTTTSGINRRFSEVKPTYYPNPVDDHLIIEYQTGFGQKIITVLDVTGRKIKSFSSEENRIQINCESWSEGIYFVKTEINQKEPFIVKILKLSGVNPQ